MKSIKRMLLCSPMGLSMACHAGDGMPMAAPNQGPQVMIYFRQPLWSPGAHRVYGLRIDQTSAPTTLPIGVGVNPLRRKEIFNLEIGQHAAMRVEFGRRLVWDVNRQEFGWGSPLSMLAFQLPSQFSVTSGRLP